MISKKFEKLNQVKEDLKDYYDHKWNLFFRDFSACGLGAVIVATPLYAFYESVLPKLMRSLPDFMQVLTEMSSDESKVLRWSLLPVIGGVAYFVDKGRIFSRNYFKKKSFGNHDGMYNSVLGPLTNSVPYGIKFGGDLSKVIPTTLGTLPLAYFVGIIEGFFTDTMKDLLGFENTNRLPKVVQNFSQKTKLGLAGLMVASSLALTHGIYEFSDSFESKRDETKKEVKLNNLEKFILEKPSFESKLDSLIPFITQRDGVIVDTPKFIRKK